MRPTIFDLETSAHPDAALYIVPPDLDAVEPRKGLVDPVKIAASSTARKTKPRPVNPIRTRCICRFTLRRHRSVAA